MPKYKYARPSRSRKPHQGNKHPGIYGNHKDITPTPKCDYILMRLSLPMEYTCALQEKYPDVTIQKAIKLFLLENIRPKDVKEI